MKRRIPWFLLAALAGHGCAAPAQEPASPPAPAAAKASPAPPPPLGAGHALLMLRWQKPARFLHERGGAEGRELTAQLFSVLPLAEATVDWSAPLELVWAADPAGGSRGFDTALALSFGVRSETALLDDARRSGARVESDGDGARYLTFPRTGLVCALPAGSPERGARPVCGPSRRDVQALSRFVTEALSRALPGSADVEADLRLAPLHGLSEPELFDVSEAFVKPLLDLQRRNQRFDQAGAHLSSEAAREVSRLIRDVDRTHGELRFDAPSETLEGVVTVHFERSHSRLLQSLLAQALHAQAAPTRFWRCPPDSSSALFVRGIEPADFRPHKELLGTLFGEVLSYQGTPPKLKEMAAELVYAVPLPKGDLVLCAGTDAAALAPARSAEAEELVLAKQRWGWRVFITGDEPDRYRSYLVKLVEAFQDPVLGPQLRRFIGAQYGETPLSVRARPPTPGLGLAHGTRLVEMTLPARELDPRSGTLVTGRAPGLKLLVAVVPLGRGGGTLIGIGSDEKLLAQKLRTVGEQGPARARLDQRTDLSRLTNTSAIAGGFWSVTPPASGADRGAASPPGAALVYTLQVDPEARRVEGRLNVPVSAVAALTALVTRRLRSEATSVGAPPR